MKYTLNKQIYFINITILLLFSISIIYLLHTNLNNQRIAIINETQSKNKVLLNFIISDIDRILFGVEELMEGIHIADEYSTNHFTHQNEMDKLLKKSIRKHIMDILIVNQKSQIIHWTAQGEKPNIKDREYIKYHLSKKKSTKTFIGQPQLSKIHKNKWFFAISKAYYKNNLFDKIVVMIVDLDFFIQRYANAIIDKNSALFIASTQGNIYTKYPDNIRYIGKKVKEIKNFATADSNILYHQITSPFDKQKRIGTLIKSEHYPIIGGASLLEKDILSSWNKQRINTLIIAIIIFLGMIILILYYSKLQKRLVKLSQTDALSHLNNRGYFTYQAQNELQRAKRFNENLSILMIDIDNFKKINDQYGHQMGDKIIQRISKQIQYNIRNIDIAARYGGEEFIVLLPKTSLDEAYKIATRIKDAFEFNNTLPHSITTLSCGIAILEKKDTEVDDIVKKADKALYRSKNSGKNKITIYE